MTLTISNEPPLQAGGVSQRYITLNYTLQTVENISLLDPDSEAYRDQFVLMILKVEDVLKS